SYRKNKDDEDILVPINVQQCISCGSIQLKHNTDPNVLFNENYNYETSMGLEEHFKDYAIKVKEMFKDILLEGDLIIEVGGNTGMLCKHFKELGFKVLNVEPSKNVAEKSTEKGIDTLVKFFNQETAQEIFEKYGWAKLVVSNNCLAHIPDLKEIILGFKILLDPNGLLVFENAYALDTIKNNDIGQFYAEHYFYHSIKPLDQILKRNQIGLFHVERNNIQCGSFRAYCINGNIVRDPSLSSVDKLIQEEAYSKLYDGLKFFKRDVDIIGNRIVEELNKYKGEKIGIYGAPAKLALILKYFKLENYFDFTVEDSVLKIDKFIPGTNIQIKNRQYFLDNPPNIMLVGAYNFTDRIIENNKQYKGKWIIPFPELKII
ncbi:MAG: class I SAM-dependent methyltransferase, partial [Nanoarchaeota archaeon]